MDHSVASACSGKTHWTTDDVRCKVEGSEVVVFAKGSREHPRCGFTERLLAVMDSCGHPYELVDVCEDKSIIPALRSYAGAHTVPAVFVNGRLVPCSEYDTFDRMFETGELQAKVDRAFLVS